MAYIHDFTSTINATASTNHTFGDMPSHATNDLLLWFVSRDANSTADLSTPSGWTVVANEKSNAALQSAVFYKVATSASESAPTTTSTTSDNFVSHMYAIRSVDTADPINTYTTAGYNGADSFTTETATTDEDNCLLLWLHSYDGNDQVVFTDPGVMFSSIRGIGIGGGSNSQTVYWSFQESAGTTPAINCYGSLSEQSSRWVVAINGANSNDVKPTYIANPTTMGSMVTPLFSSSAQHGATPTATLTLTTLGSKTLSGTGLNVGNSLILGSVPQAPSLQVLYYQDQSAPATNASAIEIQFSSAVDLSSGFLVGSLIGNDEAAGLVEIASVSNVGFLVGIADSSNNYRAFHTHARYSNPHSGERSVFVINCNQTSTDYATSGTAPTLTGIDTITLACSNFGGVSNYLYSDFAIYNTLVIGGGSSTRPFNNARISELSKALRVGLIKQLGGAAFLSYLPIQIGGADAVYCDITNSTIEFPQIYDEDTLQLNYHAEADDIGISYYGVSGDTIKHRNSTITSESQYYWEINSSATSAATWDFSGLVIVGANVTLRDVTTFDLMTFTDCVAIDASSCDLTNCTISGLTDNDDLTTNASTTFDGCTFNTTSLAAGEYMCSVADPSIFTDCSFTGSTGHAIRITSAGTYTFSGNLFSGYGADGTTSAAIFNDSGGAVTINIAGGGGTPTYRNGTSATTTINNATSISVTVKSSSTLTAISGARVFVEAASGGDLPAEDSVSITRSSSTATVSHTAHGLADGDTVVIRGAAQDEYNGVFTISYSDANTYTYTVTGTPATPATGTPTSTAVLINTTTNVSGVAENTSFSYTSDQPITGTVRKASSSPYYKPGSVVGTVTSAGFSTTILLITDE